MSLDQLQTDFQQQKASVAKMKVEVLTTGDEILKIQVEEFSEVGFLSPSS